MYIEQLALKNFRNFSALRLTEIANGINIFIGKNAMGKTNLIEAINYLSCGKSFRGARDNSLVQEDASCAGILAKYICTSHRGKIEANIFGDGRRSIRVNGMPVRKISQLMGIVNSVVFAPEDLRIIKEAPSFRRKMMDVELSKIQPGYYTGLQKYYTVLKNKNKLLKEQTQNRDLYAVYNFALVEHACAILKRRAVFITLLQEYAREFYKRLAGDAEDIQIQYRASAEIGALPGSLQKKIDAMEEREKEVRMSLVGPHREDIQISINGKDAKLYASQGQQRTAMLAIKLACAAIAEKQTGEKPVLLLDDVFSELDRQRGRRLLEIVGDGQVFITATDAAEIQRGKNAAVYSVNDAVVLPYKN